MYIYFDINTFLVDFLLSHSILVTVLNIIVLSVLKISYLCQSNITQTRGQVGQQVHVSNHRLSPLPGFAPTRVKKLRACPNMTLSVVQDVKPNFELAQTR